MRFTLQSIALALLRNRRVDVERRVGPTPPTSSLPSAAEHYRQADWQKACDAFDKLLAEHPDYARGSAGPILLRRGPGAAQPLAEARAQFDELLQRDPEHRYARQALFRSGEAAYLLGDLTAAERDLQAFHKRILTTS